jgi:trigger factor
LKITTELLENRQVTVIIELDEERTAQAMRRAARHISHEIDIPGFRRGKAPYGAIVQRYGEKVLRQEAANELVEDVVEEALEEEGIEPYGPVELNDIALDPITFTCTVPLHPAVDLGDYRDYRREMPEIEIPEEDVQEEFDELRRQNIVLEPVERPAEMGDLAVLDLTIKAVDGDEVLLEEEDLDILLEAGSERPSPDFSESIVGMEVGQDRTFTSALADDFLEVDLQGQKGTFVVELKELYERILPDLDDDLARTVGPYDSWDELEERIRRRLSEQAWEQAESEYTDQVLDDIVEQSHIEYPAYVLEDELDDVVERFEQTLKQRQHLSLEDYLRFQGQSEEELRESLRPQAKKSLEVSLVLGKLVQLENLHVEEDEVHEEIESFASLFGDRADEVRTEMNTNERYRSVQNRLLTQKAIERLVAIARGEAPALDAEGSEEGAEAELELDAEAVDGFGVED